MFSLLLHICCDNYSDKKGFLHFFNAVLRVLIKCRQLAKKPATWRFEPSTFWGKRVKWESESLKLPTKLNWQAAYVYILAVYFKLNENLDWQYNVCMFCFVFVCFRAVTFVTMIAMACCESVRWVLWDKIHSETGRKYLTCLCIIIIFILYRFSFKIK